MRFYGAQFDQGRIPWLWYKYLERWMPAAQAAEAVQAAHAVAVGALGVFDGTAHRQAVETLQDEVYKRRDG